MEVNFHFMGIHTHCGVTHKLQIALQINQIVTNFFDSYIAKLLTHKLQISP